jgi:hypothetical protein
MDRDQLEHLAFLEWFHSHNTSPAFSEKERVHAWWSMSESGRRYWYRKQPDWTPPPVIRTNKRALSLRDADIHIRHDFGVQFVELAQEYGLSNTRVSQIYHQEVARFLQRTSKNILRVRVVKL